MIFLVTMGLTHPITSALGLNIKRHAILREGGHPVGIFPTDIAESWWIWLIALIVVVWFEMVLFSSNQRGVIDPL